MDRAGLPAGVIVRFGERGYRNKMLNKKTARTITLLSVVFITAACAVSGPGAYVFHRGEFNRDSKDFGKEPKDISSVTICYNVFGTKPDEIVNMANTECRKFNKKAKFKTQVYKICPLFTPVAAVYTCVEKAFNNTYSNTDQYYPNLGNIIPNYKYKTPERRLP